MRDERQEEREPLERGPMPEPAPDLEDEDRPAEEDLPREALEEARRWDEVPGDDPERSTGIDAG